MTSTPRAPHRIRRGLALGLALGSAAALILSGCAAEPSGTPAPSTAAPAASTPAPTSTGPSALTVSGYDVGQFPPIPLFVLPDLSLLDSSASAFTIEVNAALVGIPGVVATPAHCDADGTVISGNGTAYLYGDGSGAFTGPDGSVQNFGDGSGTSTINGVTIQNFGDGAGTYTDGTVTIQNFGDGAGNYTDASKTVQIFGDGSGNYTDGETTIQNFGDGSGNYTDGDITIQNFGDGTARVGGQLLDAEPLPPVPELGVFPPLGALAPLESCGTTLTFEDGVLFDFDRSEIRPDAAATLDAVARVFTTLDVSEAHVSGHTDAIGTDAENQKLSEDRAESVVDGLEGRGVTTSLSAEGFGETRPVAANEIDGVDNPAGRQLNRRVEIFIPAAF